MSDSGINRRQFLETSGRAAAGAVIVTAAGGTTLLIAPDGAWAMSLETLNGPHGMTLLKALRVMYPHDALGDQYYAGVVAALDEEAKANADKAALLKDGVASLDQAMPVPFLELSDGNQLKVLEAIQDTDFFQTLRSKVIVTLYNNERVWEAFGYEGSSYEYGGYIERGFSDLGWLPDPPPEASPQVEL